MRQKGFALILIILVIVVLGVVGYFVLQNFKLNSSNGGTGISSTVPVANSPKPSLTTSELESIGESYNTGIISALRSGLVVKKISDPALIIPSNINKGQILNYFQLGNYYFALVMQYSTNFDLKVPNNYKITFTGLLVAKQGDTQWSVLTEIKDKQSDNANNPYYLWTDSNNLLLSVVDQNGAGSGEGIMKLFTFTSNGDWKLTGCYYFGQSYNVPSVNGDYFAYSSKLSKQIPKPLSECSNVTLISKTN